MRIAHTNKSTHTVLGPVGLPRISSRSACRRLDGEGADRRTRWFRSRTIAISRGVDLPEVLATGQEAAGDILGGRKLAGRSHLRWRVGVNVDVVAEGTASRGPGQGRAAAGMLSGDSCRLVEVWGLLLCAVAYDVEAVAPVSYTHLRAHATRHELVCRLLLEK